MKDNALNVKVIGGSLLAGFLLPLLMATLGLNIYARVILVPTLPVSPFATTPSLSR